MSRSLVLSFQSASAKYSRLHKKIKKSIVRGEFWRFTKKKRNHLLARIEKLRKRLSELSMQIKLASVGMAAAAILGATSAEAQRTTVGPFKLNLEKNPLPPPAFEKYTSNGDVQYVDVDGDGDLDAIITSENRYFSFYRNIGTKTNARFNAEYINGLLDNVYVPGPYNPPNPARAVYADLDDDGDMDMIANAFESYSNPYNPIIYFRNNKTAQGVSQFQPIPETETSPTADLIVGRYGWPSLADVDGDGDMDLIVTGQYYDVSSGNSGYMQFFRNDKSGHAPGVDPVFTPQRGSKNPFQITSQEYYMKPISFADIDQDGDPDMIYIDQYASVHYKRNDGGFNFVEQEGPWQYNAANPGQSTGNPFNDEVMGFPDTNDTYRSLTFGDLDGDGDLDATLTFNTLDLSPTSSPFIYYTNTGHGTFSQKDHLFDGVSIGESASSTLFDYDGDGDKDIVTLSRTYQSYFDGESYQTHYFFQGLVFRNNNGTFSKQADSFDLPAEVPNEGLGSLRDVDGDGDLDLLIFFMGDGPSAVYYYRNEDGEYVEKTGEDNPFDFTNNEEFPRTYADIADLDNDGLPDLLLTTFGGGSPVAYKNTGTVDKPEFTENSQWSNGFENGPSFFDPTTPSLVDMDGDGDYDLMISKYRTPWYYENQGDKTNPKFVLYQNNVDKDGNVDPNSERNPFAGTFFGQFGSFNLSDLDGDGDKDLLFSLFNSGRFAYYENQNIAPDVSVTNTAATFTLGKPLKFISQVSISDVDGDGIIKVSAQISPYQKGLEKLQLNGTHGSLAANWNDDAGLLTITGVEDFDVWIDALKSIEYIYTGTAATDKKSRRKDNAKLVQKNVTVTTLDNDETISSTNVKTFNISGDDGAGAGSPPAISGTANPFYISGELVINNNLSVTDADNVISSATVSVTSGFTAAEDVLIFADQNGITGQYNAQTGVLTLTGITTPANYQAALRSVKYSNKTTAPSTQNRSFVFSVSDGSSNASTTTVMTVNKPPVITTKLKKAAAGGNVAFTISQLVSDPDDNLDLKTLVITSQANADVRINGNIVTIDYSKIQNFQQDDVLTINVCDLGGRCTTTTTTVEVRADALIYTGMSPNGDEINDWFHIDYLPEGTHVAVYNRWGDMIYEERDYNVDDPAKRFEGKNKNGTDVIAGSYFYKVKYPDGRVKTGYILLNR